jgi:hypothetical protein
MAKQKNKPTKLHVDASMHKSTVTTRITAGTKVASTAPKSAVYQSVAVVKQAADDVSTTTAALQTSNENVVTAEAALAAARSVRDATILTFDTKYELFATTVEANVTTEQEVTGLGATLAARTLHPLEAPLGVKVTYDDAKGLIKVRVTPAPGLRQVVLEMSAEPITATSWETLPGYGLRRSLSGYAAGTYWLRVASMRKSQQSAFTAPVSVVVK